MVSMTDINISAAFKAFLSQISGIHQSAQVISNATQGELAKLDRARSDRELDPALAWALNNQVLLLEHRLESSAFPLKAYVDRLKMLLTRHK